MGSPHRERQANCPLSVPVDLKGVELRLPGAFRELCANADLSNEQIGRIVRCIALGTDSMITPDIEPVVFYYSQDQKKRLYNRLRKIKSRKKQAGMTDEHIDVIKEMDGHTFGGLPSTEFVKKSDVPQTFPIVKVNNPIPVEVVQNPQVLDPLPTSVPKQDSNSKNKRKTKEDKIRDSLADDLFSYVSGGQGTNMDRKRAADALTKVDDRNDSAWIPGNFAIFWAKYPRKVAKSAALKAFTKLIKSQPNVEKFMRTILASLDYWKKQDQWTKDNGKFIPYPASWLNAGHWNDSENEDLDMGPVQATFLQGDTESDEDLIKRMTGG